MASVIQATLRLWAIKRILSFSAAMQSMEDDAETKSNFQKRVVKQVCNKTEIDEVNFRKCL